MAPKGRPKAGVKRAAESDGGSVKRQCTSVVKALSKSELPDSVVETLKLAAPFALTTYADVRHPHQVSLIGMVDETLKGIETTLQKAVSESEGLASGKDAEKVKREDAIIQAGRERMQSKQAAASKEFEVYEATQLHRKAAAILKETKKDQKAGDKGFDKLAADKESFETLKSKITAMKETGKCSNQETKSLEKDLKPYVDDASLAESMHLVFGKEPAERSSFDEIILAKLDTELSAKDADFARKLAEEEPGKKAREDATAAAQASNDSTKEKLTALEEELAAAESTVTECEGGVSAAEAALESYASDMEEADSSLVEAQEKLEEFKAVLDTFNALKERTIPPPPPPEPEAPVPAAPEES